VPATEPLAASVRALVFDVFGTVVDWRRSVIEAGEELSRQTGLAVDWAAFADDWRRLGYLRQIARIGRGEAPYESTDAFMLRSLRELLPAHGAGGLSEEQVAWLHLVWHRLEAWPDSVEGLTRLKQRFVVATLSNGNMAQLTDMAKHAGLPWDAVLSAELVERFKPDPAVYRSAGRFLGVPLDRVVMVAAHLDDLDAARAEGMLAAFVPRPLEWGPDGWQEGDPAGRADLVADDLVDLARQLGA
jgi:2-haloacid dehalogenase